MELDLAPAAPAHLRAAVEAALVAAGVGRSASPYGGAWRLAGLAEAVDRVPAGQAPSPRRSRGAKRA